MSDINGKTRNFVEKRREERYAVPDVYQRYILMRVKAGADYIPATLANFSRSGVLFETSIPLENGAETECVISLSLILDREISFKITVKYCYKNTDSYIIGAAINTIADETWFDIFVEIHDYIVMRQGSVY